jgi:hypothetical protein
MMSDLKPVCELNCKSFCSGSCEAEAANQRIAELEAKNKRLVELLKDAQEVQTEFDTESDIAVREALASMEETMMSDDTVEIVYEATFRAPKNITEETLDEMQGLIGDFIDNQPDAYLLMDAMGRAQNMQTDD